MILLTTTSDVIKVVTGSALNTDVHASYVDLSGSTVTPGRTNTAISTATTTTVVAAPGASTSRTVKTFTVRNKDASNSQVITVQHYDGTTTVDLVKMTVAAGDHLHYDEGQGWTLASAAQYAYGKQTLWVPAGAMVSRTTNGPSSGTVELSTNKNMVRTLDFDATTQEFAQFDVRMPKSWNEGTVTFFPVWSHAATTTNFGVVWALDAVAVSDDDALDVAFGTEQTSTDTGGTTSDLYQGPESSAITIAGTPQANDYVMFRVKRNPSAASDTMAVDARLHGVVLIYTTDATNDA